MYRALTVLFAIVVTVFGWVKCASAQTYTQPLRTIGVPLPPHGGFEGGWPYVGEPADYWTGMKLLSDQKLLIVNPSESGNWSLIRVGEWWTNAPKFDLLAISGWKSSDLTRGGRMTSGLLLTNDGNYAIVLSSVDQIRDSRVGPYAPNRAIKNRADTLIVVVNLQEWKVAKTFHTGTLGDIYFRRAAMVNKERMALQGSEYGPPDNRYAHVGKQINVLVSIPDLRVGPACESGYADSLDRKTAQVASDNNEVCAPLLEEVKLSSFHRLDALLHLGSEPVPSAIEVSKEPHRRSSLGDKSVDEQTFSYRDVFARERLMTPERDRLEVDNPPAQSKAGYWYALDGEYRPQRSYLRRYDRAGKLLSERELPLRQLDGCDRYECFCRTETVREDAGAMLIFCRARTMDWWDVEHWKKHWLTVLRTDDLTDVAAFALPNVHVTCETLAVADGRTFVLALDEGRLLRVYEVPKR